MKCGTGGNGRRCLTEATAMTRRHVALQSRRAFAVALVATTVTLFAQDKPPRALSRRISLVDSREVARRRTRPRVVLEARWHPSLLRERQGGRRLSHRQLSRWIDRRGRSCLHEGRRRAAQGSRVRRRPPVPGRHGEGRRRYGSTGGWGYEHFDRDDTTGRLSGSEQATCSACHAKAPTDHVFSRIRP